MSHVAPQPNRHDQIAARAYEFWQAEGYPAGRALDHWCAAEQSFAIETAAPVVTVAKQLPAPAPRRRATRQPRARTASRM